MRDPCTPLLNGNLAVPRYYPTVVLNVYFSIIGDSSDIGKFPLNSLAKCGLQ